MVEKSVAIIIANSKNKILLQLRDNKPGIVYAGCWAFLGGHVEKNETYLDAVNREIREEINQEIRDIQIIGDIEIKEEGISAVVFKGRLDVNESEIDLTEGQKVKFFGLDELETIEIPKVLKEFIHKNKHKILD